MLAGPQTEAEKTTGVAQFIGQPDDLQLDAAPKLTNPTRQKLRLVVAAEVLFARVETAGIKI